MWPFSALVVPLWQPIHSCCNGSLTKPSGVEATTLCTAAVKLSGCKGQVVFADSSSAITLNKAVSLHRWRLCLQQQISQCVFTPISNLHQIYTIRAPYFTLLITQCFFPPIHSTYIFSHTYTPFWSNLGFSGLFKETSTCGHEEEIIIPPTL